MSRRFFKHGELHLVILSLLSERPMHGYDLLAALSRLFGSRYRPSPGSVYPALEALEAEGLVDGEESGTRTTYRVTPAGAEALADRLDALAALEHRTGARVHRVESLDSVLATFKARIAPISAELEMATVADALERAAADIEGRRRPANEEDSR